MSERISGAAAALPGGQPAASQVLSPLDLPLHGLRLIEASAGTGKTYTIAMLYARLVLGHDRTAPGLAGTSYLPPDILVLTFTEAAAGELRDRIRQRLCEAAGAFRLATGEGDADLRPAGDALLRALVADYPRERHEQCAFLLEQAAQWLDEAAIGTIHGWCLRVLQQHAFDSGSLFAQTLVQDLAPLREQAVRDVWRRWFYPLPAEQAGEIAELLKGPDQLAATLAPLLGADEAQLCHDGMLPPRPWREAWRCLAQAMKRRDELRAALWAGWREAGSGVLALLRAAIAGKALKNNLYKPAWPDRLAADMAAWLDGGEAPARLDRCAPDSLRAAAAKGREADVPAHAWFDQVAAWCEAGERLEEQRRALLLALLADLRLAVLDDMAAQLRQRAEMGFDDLLRRVDAALAGPHGERLAARIRGRCPVALIDEFQDTDPLQFRIFEQLYRDRPDTALLMIGDPKQAIYSFRGADLPTYLRARALASQPTWTLSTNFRSDPSLVAGVNRLFSFRDWPGGAFAQPDAAHGLQFSPVSAGRGEGRLRRRLPDGSLVTPAAVQIALPDDIAALTTGKARRLLAEQCAETILGWLQAADRGEFGLLAPDTGGDDAGGAALCPVGPGDIAVLVRKGSEARVLRQALQARGIPSVYGSDRDSVYASGEAGQLQRWLEAFADPGREERLRLALATPALGRSWGELARLRADERAWEHEVEVLRDMQAIWRASGVLAAVRQWLFRQQVPARLLHPDCRDGERALTNFLHLAELLQAASTGLHGEQALIRHLAERREGQGGQGGDEALVRLESDSARVRVVTLHQSKGLEYPLVCLPFSAVPALPRKGGLRRYHRDDGALVMDLDSDEASAASRRAAHEQLQEDLRLFYVGVTRPRHLLWMALLPVGGKQEIARHTPWQWLLGAGADLDAAGFMRAAWALADDPALGHAPWLDIPRTPVRWLSPQGGQALRPAQAFPGLPPVRWRIASYSGLQVEAVTPAPLPASVSEAESARAETWREQLLSGLAALPRGAEIGSFWHTLLEEAAAAGFAHDADSLRRLDDIIARECALRRWAEQAPVLQRALRAWLRHDLGLPAQPDGRQPAAVALGDLRTYQVELEFWLSSHRVDVQALDHAVRRHTLGGRPRPALLPARLEGLFKGFMDLVFLHDGRYYIADYKSNFLGDAGADAGRYAPDALAEDVARHRYDLQYALYLLALHRQLRARLPDYDYDRHVGGAVYLYLRGWDGQGGGVHAERPPRALVEALDALFAGGGQ